MDRDAYTARIAATNGHLYQLQPSGAIYEYPGIPCTSRCYGPGWWLRDFDPTAKAIYADGDLLYKLRRDGTLWLQPNSGSAWSQIHDAVSAFDWRISIAAGGGTVAVLYRDGLVSTVVSSSNLASSRWVKSVQIALDDQGNLYSLDVNGALFNYGNGFLNNPALDINPATVAFAIGASGLVYKLHNDGSIWHFASTYWERLDNNPAAVEIVAAGNDLYQLHGDGSLWHYTGAPCSGDVCSGWEMIMGNGVGRVAAAGNRVYVLSGPTAAQRPLARQAVCSECL